MPVIADVVRALVGQERAVSNARAAATDLLQQRVERLDVELYLAERAEAFAVRSRTGDSAAGTTGVSTSVGNDGRLGDRGDETLAARRG